MENNNIEMELTLESTVTLNSLSNYEIGYHSDVLGVDIVVPGYAKGFETTVADVKEQIEKGNVAFVGVDGMGAHASFYIVDDATREFIWGTSEKPIQFTKEAVEEMLQYHTEEEFKAALEKTIVTNHEALLMLNSMRYLHNELDKYEWKTKMLKDHCECIVKGIKQ